MKPISMKVPPLNQLYEQKQGYKAHKKKLQSIISQRKNHLLEVSRERNSKKIITNFERKYNARSLELARENSKIINKIQKVKSNLSRKQSIAKPNQSIISSAFRTKSRILQQEKQNYRIKSKVQSMNSSLSSKLMDKDYRRSLQIRNRIMHFKTQQNHKVMLKANRYFHNQSASNIIQKSPLKQPLPQLSDSRNFNKEIIEKKLSQVTASVASHYKKEEIMKNRVVNANKMFKLARERRTKAVTMLQKNNIKPQQKSVKQQVTTVFATELPKSQK